MKVIRKERVVWKLKWEMTGNHWKNQCLNDEGSKHYTSKKCTNIK